MDMLKDERFDFTILENDVVRDVNRFTKNELLAYIAISYHADKQGQCFPSYEGIARIMRTSRTTAINAVQGLVEKGIIKLENRQADEKKNHMTSNLYTLVSNSYWEQAERENRIYVVKKDADYKVRYAKGKATKLANQLKNDKKNTPDSMAVESDVVIKEIHKTSFDKSIIPQENMTSKHESIDKTRQNMTNNKEMSDALKQRLDLLKNADIKYVPYKKDAGFIESMDLEILKKAIETTIIQSNSRSWRYVLSTYNNELLKKSAIEQKKTQRPQYRGGIGMANCVIDGKNFKEWNPEDINSLVERANKRVV